MKPLYRLPFRSPLKKRKRLVLSRIKKKRTDRKPLKKTRRRSPNCQS